MLGRQRAGFLAFGPVSGFPVCEFEKAGFRVTLRVPVLGENSDINYVFLDFIFRIFIFDRGDKNSGSGLVSGLNFKSGPGSGFKI